MDPVTGREWALDRAVGTLESIDRAVSSPGGGGQQATEAFAASRGDVGRARPTSLPTPQLPAFLGVPYVECRPGIRSRPWSSRSDSHARSTQRPGAPRQLLSSLASPRTSRVRFKAPRPPAGRTRQDRHATHSTPGSAGPSVRCCATGTPCRRRPAVLAQTSRRGCPGCSGRAFVHPRQLDRGRGRGRRDARAAPGLQTRAGN